MSSEKELGDFEERLAAVEEKAEKAYNKSFTVGDWALDNEDHIDDLEECLEAAERKLETATRMAVTSLSLVRDMQAERQQETKVEVAKRLGRNELVRRVSTGMGASQRPISRGKLIEIAEPDHSLYHQTVRDAFAQLESEYEAFYRKRSNGEKALSVDPDVLRQTEPELVMRAALDTGREDLVENVLDGNGDMVAQVAQGANIDDIISGGVAD